MHDPKTIRDASRLFCIGLPFYSLHLLFLCIALKQMWSWFIAETFGIQAINYGQSLGIVLMIQLLLSRAETTDERGADSKIGLAEYLFDNYLSPLILLAAGWAIHLLIR